MKVKEFENGANVFAIIDSKVVSCEVIIVEKKKVKQYHLKYRTEKGKEVTNLASKKREVFISEEETLKYNEQYIREQEEQRIRKEEAFRVKIEEEIRVKEVEKWIDDNIDELANEYRGIIENVDYQQIVCDWVKTEFNNKKVYDLNFVGQERGRYYYSTSEIDECKVKEFLEEEGIDLSDGKEVLKKLYTGSNIFYNYTTFFDELNEFIEELLYDKIYEIYGSTDKRFLSDDFQTLITEYEEILDIKGDYRYEWERNIDWKMIGGLMDIQ